MALGIKSSHVVAAVITIVLAGWMLSGSMVVSGIGDPQEPPGKTVLADNSGADNTGHDDVKAPAPAIATPSHESRPFAVRTRRVSARERRQTLTVRGRTEAVSRVSVRAETAGLHVARNFKKGDRIAAGDVLCTLDKGARAASLKQAESQLAKQRSDLEAARALQAKGYGTDAQVRALKAAVDGATAARDLAKLELERTVIAAPVTGTIVDPIAEQGDMLGIGGVCATIVTIDPILFVGQIAERDIASLKTGMPVRVTPLGGSEVTGTLTYVAPSAETRTRTFRVEATIANRQRTIRDGATAHAVVPLRSSRSHLLPQSALLLSDDGRIGVKIALGDRVKFVPLNVDSDGRDGVWVSGLPDTADVIVVGQHYVVDGQAITAVPVDAARVATQ